MPVHSPMQVTLTDGPGTGQVLLSVTARVRAPGGHS
jgi:hypothetical protein